MDDYDTGYSDGENSVAVNWHFALTEILGLNDSINAFPSETAHALKEVLTDAQIHDLNDILLRRAVKGRS